MLQALGTDIAESSVELGSLLFVTSQIINVWFQRQKALQLRSTEMRKWAEGGISWIQRSDLAGPVTARDPWTKHSPMASRSKGMAQRWPGVQSQDSLKSDPRLLNPMARVKWEQMTDESQAMVKKVGLISVGGVILLAFSKMIFPW